MLKKQQEIPGQIENAENTYKTFTHQRKAL